LAAFASLGFIRVMCHFNSIQQGGSAVAGPTASQALPEPLAAAGPSTSSAVYCNAKERPDGLKAADSDAAMARGMSGHKDQLSSQDPAASTSGPSPFVEAAESGPCKACGRSEGTSPGASTNKEAGPTSGARAPVGDLLKPFTIYLQVNDVRAQLAGTSAAHTHAGVFVMLSDSRRFQLTGARAAAFNL
jgi:hypothetical protein